ncbi:heavy-metal-associated domain-containing protein [Candidatus Micrarchaeota archaeon]|nr:heavy-metal-associated domain-containing protein [Candidatus Micrarchaeota archaeon]
MEKVFKIKGMHCDSCNWLISENVKEVVGVKAVKADYHKGEAKVDFGPPAQEKQIVAAIEKEGGYKVI